MKQPINFDKLKGLTIRSEGGIPYTIREIETKHPITILKIADSEETFIVIDWEKERLSYITPKGKYSTTHYELTIDKVRTIPTFTKWLRELYYLHYSTTNS